MEGTHTGAVCKELQPEEGPMLGKSGRGHPPDGEGVSETSDELITTPIPHSPVPQKGGDGEFTSEVKPGSAY